MTVEFFVKLFSVLALVANAAVLGWLGLVLTARFSHRAASVLETVVESVGPAVLLLGLAVASVATLGSLYLSEIAHFVPCKLCWYQRIAMYPLAALLGIALWRRDFAVRVYIVPIAAIGGGISVYHYLIQHFPRLESGSCDPSAPCTAAWVWEFGFVSIPYMAGSAFALLIALMWIGRRVDRP